MSLKDFHIFFITVASLAAFGLGLWCFIAEVASDPIYIALGVGSMVAGVGLIVYGKMFLRKMKREGIE